MEVPLVLGPPSHHSDLVLSKRQAIIFSCPALNLDSSTHPGADVQEMAPMDAVEVEEEEKAPPPVQASSSSSLDGPVAGPSNPLLPDDFRAHQELLKRVTANLGLDIKELTESVHSLIDILAAATPSRVALPINEVVM